MSAARPNDLLPREPCTPSDWDAYFDLRWRVLRQPWGQPRGSERDPTDDNGFHLMIQGADDSILAVGRLHSNSPEEAQVRYMAVDPAHQGSGLGKMILKGLEDRARSQGITTIVLNARENAVGFYTRQGYDAIGPGETLFGEVRHTRMSKSLGPVSPP